MGEIRTGGGVWRGARKTEGPRCLVSAFFLTPKKSWQWESSRVAGFGSYCGVTGVFCFSSENDDVRGPKLRRCPGSWVRRRRRAITEPDISRWGGGGRCGVGGYDVWWPGVCDGVQRVMLKMLPVHRGCGYSILMGGGVVRAQQLWKTWWGRWRGVSSHSGGLSEKNVTQSNFSQIWTLC